MLPPTLTTLATMENIEKLYRPACASASFETILAPMAARFDGETFRVSRGNERSCSWDMFPETLGGAKKAVYRAMIATVITFSMQSSSAGESHCRPTHRQTRKGTASAVKRVPEMTISRQCFRVKNAAKRSFPVLTPSVRL